MGNGTTEDTESRLMDFQGQFVGRMMILPSMILPLVHSPVGFRVFGVFRGFTFSL